MDRDRSLERRYCFNGSIRNPAAESTKLNNSNANRSGLGCSFKWGSSPISPRQRSNSNVNLINLDSTFGGDGLERSRYRSMRKIDPRIVADVQSKGLASRIVKYHENGNRLNRSMSAHNLYSKPGQFPVVTLKKTELPYRATKQNVSMTRIAPPEKSVFYGSTLSSLLRSNSVVGLHKSDEDISRENRPILHPPPTENDMAPTRSVLDVLKEISRKRINSDDPDVLETSKKNRIGNDMVDTGAQTMMTHSFKRQRDLNSPNNVDVIAPAKYPDTRFSPEQAKKRVCNYNNDISSSLSSSVTRRPNINKRPSHQLNQTMPFTLEYYETQKKKTPKCDGRSTLINGERFNNLENTTSKVGNLNVSGGTTTSEGAVVLRSKSDPIAFEKEKSIVVNNKPRLTLFNKTYDVCNADDESAELDDKLDVPGECAGIHFVKPKKLSSSGLKNPVIERAQKSKLALMLSGLRGELYHDSEYDELDAPQKTLQDKQNDNDASKAVGQDKKKTEGEPSVATTTTAALTNTTANISNISSLPLPVAAAAAAPKLPETTVTANSKTQFTMKNPSSNSSPLVGLKLTPPTTAAASLSTTPQKAEVTQSISTPILQGFTSSSAANMAQPAPSFSTTTAGQLGAAAAVSFGAMTQSTFTAKTVASSSNTNPPADLAKALKNPTQLANIGLITTAATTTTVPATANTFVFSSANGLKTNVANISAFTTANVLSSVPQLTSVVSSAPSTTTVPATSSSTTTSSMLSNNFSFGTNITTASAPSPNPTLVLKPVATSATAAAPFSFGSPSNMQTNSSTPNVKSAGGGGFCLENANATTAPATNTQFSFGSAVAPNNNASAAGNALSFGTASNNKLPPMFNAATPKAAPTLTSAADATKPSFALPAATNAPVFGSASTTTASNMFGSSNEHAQSMFGSSAAKTTFGSEGSKQSSSIFGGSSAANNVINFGQATADKPGTTAVSAGGFSFGSAATTATAGAGSFTFGATTNSASNANSSNSDPASAELSKSFSFGSAPEKNNATSIFGGSASSGPTNPASGGFSFSSNAATAAVQKPSSSTFAFGVASSSSVGGNPSIPASGFSGNSTISSPPAGGFSFGAVMQQKTNDTSLGKAFSFGSSAPNSNNQALTQPSNNPVATNMFASTMMNKPASPAFNFGATAATPTPQATVAPAAVNNIFAPPAIMAAPGSGDRPIRRATRRLQK